MNVATRFVDASFSPVLLVRVDSDRPNNVADNTGSRYSMLLNVNS